MTTTTKLGFTCYEENHANAETTLNQNQDRVDSMMHLVFESRTTTAQPGSPTDGQVYLLPGSATGTDWAGNDGKIAMYHTGTGWEFITAAKGMRAKVADEDEDLYYDGSNWQTEQAGPKTITDAPTIVWDAGEGPVGKVTLGGNRTMDPPSGTQSGRIYTLFVVQDGTGNRTLTWNSVYKFPGGTAPTLSTGANDEDVFVFVAQDADLYLIGSGADMA